MSAELKRFPKHPNEIYPPQFNANSDHWRAALQDYERARADAWEARARLAFDLLTRMSAMVHSVHQRDIDDFFRDLGPLPKEQT